MLTDDVASRARRRVGTILCAKWQLDAVLGVGGMATVFAATHRNRNRVAIKLLHPELSFEEGIRTRFLREGYAANTVGHPAAVRVLDDDVTEDGAAFLVMELLEGESLEERCRRQGGKLSLAEALQIAEQLLDVLVAAHERGVLHRDIKPENLFITTRGELKVLDFGIARFHQGTGSTRFGSFMGTPGYSAPEQARGRWNQVDERSDLFAVGATLFAALSGRQVHQAETPSEQLALAIGTPAPALASVVPDVPAEVASLIDRALAYDKADRWPHAMSMRQAVQEVLKELPTEPIQGAPRRSREVKIGTPTTSTSFGSGDRVGNFGSIAGLTTSPASPRALASARRIATGVIVAACSGLAVGLGTWWITHVSLTRAPVEAPIFVPSRAEPLPDSLSQRAASEEAQQRSLSGPLGENAIEEEKASGSAPLRDSPAIPTGDSTASPSTPSPPSPEHSSPDDEALPSAQELSSAEALQRPASNVGVRTYPKGSQEDATLDTQGMDNAPSSERQDRDGDASAREVASETTVEGRAQDNLHEDPFERRY